MGHSRITIRSGKWKGKEKRRLHLKEQLGAFEAFLVVDLFLSLFLYLSNTESAVSKIQTTIERHIGSEGAQKAHHAPVTPLQSQSGGRSNEGKLGGKKVRKPTF
jgi:hypothetical protein